MGALGLSVFIVVWSASQAIAPEGEGGGQDTVQAGLETALRPPTAISHIYQGDFLDDLPIHGHAYQDALTLAPAVSDPDADGRVTIHGARESEVAFRLDGGEITDPLEGSSGMELNPYVIERLEVTTSGAPAGMGRALGGFVDITTRSGGNDLAGKLGLFWRGSFLDGDGAGNEDQLPEPPDQGDFHDVRAAARVGGAFVEDRLWWFGALEGIDSEAPSFDGSAEPIVSARGLFAFGKLTWQIDPDSRLTLQAAADPRTTEGLGLEPGTDASSGYTRDQSALDVRLGWTMVLSPNALLEASLNRYDQSLDIEPESDDFTRVDVGLFPPRSVLAGPVAVYPCATANCSESAGDNALYRYTARTGRTSGPYFVQARSDLRRDALRADVSTVLPAGSGAHHVRGGFELGQEEVDQDVLFNPFLYDATTPLAFQPNPDQVRVMGFQVLQVYLPAAASPHATTFSGAVHVSDVWKPRGNVSITAGLRLDTEQIDFPGYQPFDPRDERVQSYALWEQVCDEAVRQGSVFVGSDCDPQFPFAGQPPHDARYSTFYDADGDGENDVDPELMSLDIDGDGMFFGQGEDGESLYQHFTPYGERKPGNFTITERSVSPRVGVSWDPSSTGRMKLFAHWGRYHDRLDPEAVTIESWPDWMAFTFTPDQSFQILPGAPSRTAAVPSIRQVDHDLRVPRMDELSLGVEGSFASAWRAGLSFVHRRTDDLLQDSDHNHHTCAQAGVVGVDPAALCGDANGMLDTDRFGRPGVPGGFPAFPNGLIDLYTASPMYNSVLVVENTDGAETTSWVVSVVRDLHHNWQMRAGYTFSRTRGEATDTFALARDDASVDADEDDWLATDERHSLELQAVWRLPADVVLGGMMRWDSGLPYTVYGASEVDLDSSGNSTFRLLLPTGEANDQRNEGRWRLDARLEKGFRIGRVRAAGFLSAQNLLNDDGLVVTSYTQGGYVTAVRDFGRRFEIGSTVSF